MCRRVTWGDWGATTMTAAKKMVDKIPMGETTTKMLAATVSSVSTMPTASYVWAAESMAAVKRGVKVGTPDDRKIKAMYYL